MFASGVATDRTKIRADNGLLLLSANPRRAANTAHPSV